VSDIILRADDHQNHAPNLIIAEIHGRLFVASFTKSARALEISTFTPGLDDDPGDYLYECSVCAATILAPDAWTVDRGESLRKHAAWHLKRG
jgi:hypothetical protein